MREPYQFAFHERVSSTAPYLPMFERCKEAFAGGKKLSRKEKDAFFHSMRGNSGNQNYKMGGWAYPFKQFLKCYLVKYKHTANQWTEIWAFDKQCIRSSYYTNSLIEKIIEL